MMTAALMDLIDATIVNVALPTIGRDLQASGPSLEWVVSAYLLAFAAVLITAGRIGDLVGRKRMFLAGVATFGLASLACGLSRNPGELIAARAAAAIMLPQVLATLRTVFTGQERGAAFGIYGAMGGIATAAGLLLGGVLTSANILGWGWRTIFFVNVPVALATLIAAAVLVPETRSERPLRPDLRGMALAAAAWWPSCTRCSRAGRWAGRPECSSSWPCRASIMTRNQPLRQTI
jgi:MFS family permease